MLLLFLCVSWDLHQWLISLRALGIYRQVGRTWNLLAVPGIHTPASAPLSVQRGFTLRGKQEQKSFRSIVFICSAYVITHMYGHAALTGWCHTQTKQPLSCKQCWTNPRLQTHNHFKAVVDTILAKHSHTQFGEILSCWVESWKASTHSHTHLLKTLTCLGLYSPCLSQLGR